MSAQQTLVRQGYKSQSILILFLIQTASLGLKCYAQSVRQVKKYYIYSSGARLTHNVKIRSDHSFVNVTTGLSSGLIIPVVGSVRDLEATE